MSAEIWNTYDLAVASGIGVFVGAIPVAALMVLKRLDGSRELATAKGWWEKAIRVQEANDKARWAPAYSENLFAIEPADVEPLDATVLHVKYPTQELRLVADDPQVAAGLAVLADEVGLVQALSDRPAADEDEVGDEQPGEARWFRLRFIAATLLFPLAWLLYKASPAVEYVADKWAEFQQTRRERNNVGSGEQATSADPFAELLAHVEAKPIVLDPDDEAALQAEHKAWKAANPPTNSPYVGRHWLQGIEHTGIFPAINVSIPTQRTEGE